MLDIRQRAPLFRSPPHHLACSLDRHASSILSVDFSISYGETQGNVSEKNTSNESVK